MEANAKITRLSEHNAEMEKRSVCLEKVQRERDIFEKLFALLPLRGRSLDLL